MNEAMNEIENRIIDGQFKRLITNENATSVWKNKLSTAKNEAQINALLSEMYSAPQLLINAQKASLKFFNARNIDTKFPELARFSNAEKAQIFSKVFPRKLNFRGARLAQIDPASQCAGGCSNQLNIDLSTARTQLWIDALSAAANDDYVGIVQSFASYVIAFEGAMSTFENCWNGCQ